MSAGTVSDISGNVNRYSEKIFRRREKYFPLYSVLHQGAYFRSAFKAIPETTLQDISKSTSKVYMVLPLQGMYDHTFKDISDHTSKVYMVLPLQGMLCCCTKGMVCTTLTYYSDTGTKGMWWCYPRGG